MRKGVITTSVGSLGRRGGGALAGMIVGGLAALTGARRAQEPWETGQPAALVLDAPDWPAAFPLSVEHLSRIDQSPDTRFYAEPRLVQHIDEGAIAVLGRHYAETLPKGGVILDPRPPVGFDRGSVFFASPKIMIQKFVLS